MMNVDEALHALETAGSAQTRKTYARHGIGERMYGVSYAELGKLRKKIKIDHELAVGLWESGNHDARVLATMIADPATLTAAQLDQWAKDLDNAPLAGALASLAAKSRFALKRVEKWTAAKDEWIACLGWSTLAMLAKDSELDDAYFLPYVATIEREIHQAKNRAREAMNQTLIGIGARNVALRERALAAARAIGPVEVDHGETNCKTPDAADYIRKTWEHRTQKARR